MQYWYRTVLLNHNVQYILSIFPPKEVLIISLNSLWRLHAKEHVHIAEQHIVKRVFRILHNLSTVVIELFRGSCKRPKSEPSVELKSCAAAAASRLFFSEPLKAALSVWLSCCQTHCIQEKENYTKLDINVTWRTTETKWTLLIFSVDWIVISTVLFLQIWNSVE